MRLETEPSRSQGPGLTPIIDVVFLLLMFFMLASTFSRFAHVDIALAGRVALAPTQDATSILLSVRPDGLFVNGSAVRQDELAAALRRAATGGRARVLVRPAAEATAEAIVGAIEQTRASGLGPILLVR